MKRLLFLSLTSIMLLFISCKNEGPITGTESPPSQIQSDFHPQWIGLPKNDNIKLLKSFRTIEYITKEKGGNLTIDEEYRSGRETVHTYSDIYFAPGCVKRDGFIYMHINDETGVTSFLPGQTFNFPAILNQTFTGLNLNGRNANKIHLYFMNPRGNWEIMECDDLIVDIKSGSITVVNGKLPHFSVYGYGE